MAVLNIQDHLRFHWRQAKADFWRYWQACFEHGATPQPLLLVLGTIRSLYWQALGQGFLPLAKTICFWWARTAPLHQLGKGVC